MNSNPVGFVAKLISALLTVITGFFALFPANTDRLELDKAEQITRIEQLEKAYGAGKIDSINKADFFTGDLSAELLGGIKPHTTATKQPQPRNTRSFAVIFLRLPLEL